MKVTCAKELAQLPKDIWDLFLPKDLEELALLEDRIDSLAKREHVRNHVMKLQRQFGLPIRPNMSLERTKMFCRLVYFKKKREKEGEKRWDSGKK